MPTPEPIIIGVADIINRTVRPIEPLDLISNAIINALRDTGLSAAYLDQLRQSVDDLSIVKSWTWPYDDFAKLLAEKAGVPNAHRKESDHGGNQPVKCLDEACRLLMDGERKVAVLAGGEALDSLTRAAKSKHLSKLPWTKTSTAIDNVFSPTTRPLAPSYGARHRIGAPIQIYPLFENGFRAHRKQSIRGNHEESAQLYADFEQVAAENPYAWNYARRKGKHGIMTVGEGNRMVCWPYPLLMNAFNNVNLAAAVIVTTTDTARALGVHEDRWIYVRGAAGTSESADFWNRSDFRSSPAISRSLDTALASAGLEAKDIDFHDFYSCFPIVPKLACQHLGLLFSNRPKPITVLGGLTSFGGAGNNYSMHALTESVRQLRLPSDKRARHALVLANGGVLTYQHVAILSTQPREDTKRYTDYSRLPPHLDLSAPEIAEQAEGNAVIETFTADFDKKGKPALGHIVGRLEDGRRFLANHGDERTLRELVSWDVEAVGRKGIVRYDAKEGRNLFVFERWKGLGKL
ncbi:hypothetical protein CAC42_6369 [Sphaceloma murrayae]|uniref:Uncharacterized protein n=1 Tax=Sphaceloma murrayae TaxID=2082308 RepID=A0A2K1QMQ9_9PEZI|nr:hypothetical protein CAC42_6369 [Sphaceloma murrayae]